MSFKLKVMLLINTKKAFHVLMGQKQIFLNRKTIYKN